MLDRLVLNSESVGFQSLGLGTGDSKMHAPKNRNSPGTLLENLSLLGCKAGLILSKVPGKAPAIHSDFTIHLGSG